MKEIRAGSIVVLFWVAFFMLPFTLLGQTEQEIATKAATLFNKEQYVEATPLYLRLLSLNPRDHNYNYRYGTCLLYNSDKKQDAFKYLNYAAKGGDVEIEVFYFLGKAYHLTFEFNKAIEFYKKYKNVAGSKAVQRLDVDRQIEMCQNGKRLLSHISEVIVVNRKLTGIKDFFRLYDLSNIGGTIIVTEEFQTKLDKKNEHVPLIHFPAKPTQIFYSSYGDDERTGKDIYVRRKLPDGSWGQAQKIRGGVNTRYDEDFPYMHPNGKFLYFCSKGHNSMGGYDVFRAPYFPDDDSFGDPENLDFAVSSPDDDLFYVVDSLDRNAFFASARQSQDGKIHVYQVRVQKSPDQLVVFKGNFVSQINPAQKVVAVQIKDVASGRRVGSYKSNAKDGSFLITLPKGGKYEYSMQIEGSPDIHLAVVEAPFLEELRPLKQRIIAYEEAGEEQVRVENLFNELFEDVSDILAEVLKGKAQLQPNSDAFDLDALDKGAVQKELLSNLGLQRYNPQELSDLAKQDVARWEREVSEGKDELSKLLTVAEIALKAANQADSLAEALIKDAGATTNAARIQSLIDQASAQKFIAQKELENANQALAMHKVLEKELQRAQENLGKAKDVARIFSGVNFENLKEKVTEVDKIAGEYVQKNFNKGDGKSAAQRLYEKSDELGSLSGLNKKRGEVQQLQETIRKRELEITKLEKEKEFAKKKELEELERRITKLQADNNADQEMIGVKNREILLETKKENELIAKKIAIDRTRDISDNTINRNLTPEQLAAQVRQAEEKVSEANMMAFTNRIKQLEQDLASATVKEGGVAKEIQRDPKDVTQKQPDTQGKDAVKPANQVTVKPTSEDVARLNPQLKQREDAIRTQDLTAEEKAEAQLGVEKQWVVELSKEINKKEQALKTNPNDPALKREAAVLKETLAEKKQNIENLKQVAPKETPREKETSELVAQLKPDYEEQKKKAQANPNVGNRLNQLNANDKKLIAEIEERLENLSSVNTTEAKREKELLAQRVSELKEEVEERNSTINLLADSGEETRIEEPKEETKVDALPTKIKSDYAAVQNKLNKAQTPAEKNAVKRELQALLSAANSELFKAEERLAQNPQDTQRQAEKQALEELLRALEGDLERIENALVAQQTDPKTPTDSPEVRNAIAQQTKQLTEIEQRNNRLADAPDKANAQRALLKELDQLIAETEKLVQNNPTQSELNANLATANQLKTAIEEELRQTELAQQDKQVASSGTIRDNTVNQLTAKSEQQRTTNAPISEQIRTKEELIAAITKAEAQLEKDLKKNPSDAALLAEKQALDGLKDKTRDEIAELRQTELAQQDKQVAASGTIRDNAVNQLTAKSEQQRTANAPISEQIRTKEDLIAAITKAEAQVEKDLKKNPSDAPLLAEKQALAELKNTTQDEIAELRQTELAQQDKQVASSGTIRDNAVNQLTAKSEEQRTTNAPISEQIRTKEELIAAITKAETQLDKDLKKNPSDAALLAQKQALDGLKDKTRDEIAGLRQTELAQQDKQVASSGTIRDNAVNQLTAKSEQQRTANAPISEQIRTKEELIAAISKAEAQLEKELKKNPTDAVLLAEKQALTELKTTTQTELAALRTTQTDAQRDLTTEERIAQIDWKDAKGIEKAFNATPLFESIPNEPAQLTSRKAELMAYRKELTQLAAETSLSSAQRKAVEQEIKRVDEQIGLIDRMLNELVITFSPEKGMVQTNDPKINALQDEFVQTSAREAELTAKLNEATPSERKQLEKELAQVQAKRQQLNADLVVAQKAALTQQTEAELRKVEQADATDPMLILQARQTEKQLEVTQQAIESVEEASKKQRNERAEEAAQERNELLKRVDELATYQAVQDKAEEVLRQSGLTKEQVFGTDAEAYALEQLKLERNELEAQIRKLRAEQQTASKKRIPIIEVEIGQMTMEVEQLNKAIADLEAKGVQPVVAQTTTNSVVKQNQAVDYAALSEKEVLDIAREKEYVKVSNQINELQLLENQLQNKQLEEANLRNQVVGKIKRAAVTYDQAEAAKLEREAAQDAVKLAKVRKEIEELRKEINAVDESIRMNPLWNKGDQQKLVAVALAGVQPVRQAQTTAPEQQTGLNYIATSAASTTTTPIAMNPKLPGGIVYKVQVGAFARPVPDNTFKEFAPVSGEQVNNSGLIRYMVGLFADKGSAYQAQARVRSLGYKDAFVVAFCDGERMTVAQADQLIREGKCKLELFQQQLALAQSSDPVEQASAVVNKPKSTYQLGSNAAPADAVEDIPGLFFTVQVGVYNTPVSADRLFNINPLNTNLSEKGQIRYSTGRFDEVNAAIARRNEVRQMGVLDAFVTAYYNGVRISVADARKLLDEKGNGILASELMKLVPADGEIGIVLKPVEDTRRKLNDKLVRTVFVSEDTYTYYPQRELDALRKANWVYYDELTGHIVSLPKSEIKEFAPWPDTYPMKAEQRYQGFTWDQSRGLFLESLDQENPTQPWHVLEVTWEGNLGQLAAVYLQHAPFAILDWNAAEGRIVFGPLTYARKEELKQILQTIPFIQLSESLLVWE